MIDSSRIRVDYLHNHRDYKVVQHEDFYHFNTDTCLLGDFIRINKNEKVLDVGTNNGALLVYIINKGGIAYGIEILSDALKMAELTLKENNFEATLINGDFSVFRNDFKFDVIVSNPPYFDSIEKEKNKDGKRSVARHEGSLTLQTLIRQMAVNLKEDGRIYMVHRPERLAEIEKELNKNSLYLNDYAYAADTKDKKIKSVLIEASFKDKKRKMEDILF